MLGHLLVGLAQALGHLLHQGVAAGDSPLAQGGAQGMGEGAVIIDFDVGVSGGLRLPTGHQMGVEQRGAPRHAATGTAVLPGFGRQLGGHDKAGVAERFLGDHLAGLMAVELTAARQDDLLDPAGLTHTNEAGTTAGVAGVLHHQQMNIGIHGLGELVPLVITHIAVWVIEVKIRQAGDLIAQIRLLTLRIGDVGAVSRDVEHEHIAGLGAAGEPPPTLQQSALEAGLIQQQLHISAGEPKAIKQHPLDVQHVIDTATQGLVGIGIDAAEERLACHGRNKSAVL